MLDFSYKHHAVKFSILKFWSNIAGLCMKIILNLGAISLLLYLHCKAIAGKSIYGSVGLLKTLFIKISPLLASLFQLVWIPFPLYCTNGLKLPEFIFLSTLLDSWKGNTLRTLIVSNAFLCSEPLQTSNRCSKTVA